MLGANPMTDAGSDRFEALLTTVAEHHPQGDLEPIRRAHALRRSQPLAHKRRDGIDADGAVESALVLAQMRLDPPAVAAALVAGHGLAAELVEAECGAEVSQLVEGVSRLAQIRWDRIEEEAAETLRKMFMAMAADIRVVLVALAQRLQQMRALDERPQDEADAERRRRLAHENMEVFAPLANRLGIWRLKWELEDRSFRELERETYEELRRLLRERQDERDDFVASVIEQVQQKLVEHGIKGAVSGRPKHAYSIYKKMQRKEVDFAQIYDVVALRIITEELADCYAALGVIHSLWVPVPGEFDDYIARPKDNLYQSLHTAVIGLEGRPLEVQIRTQQMHHYAEHGVAAHWAYKESRKRARDIDQRFTVLRQLMDWEREVTDPHQFVESLKTDIFEDQVYVFTPAGDVLDLPLGSTPIDFAYRIHTGVGHRCRGARANDQIVPLDYQLQTGDRVEILTQKHEGPSRDWLNPSSGYLRTSTARQKVRQWYRAQNQDTAIAEGRELVERELGRLDLRHTTVDDVAAQLKYASTDDLYAAVGHGNRSAQSVGSSALALERAKAPPEEPPVPSSAPEPSRKRLTSGLSLDGVDDILGKRARCCSPMPGDAVVGYVSRGRGITIHRRDCSHVVGHTEPERLVDIDWGPRAAETYAVDVQIRAHDRPGLLRDLSALVSQSGVNMTAARARANNKDGSAWIKLSLELGSAEQVVGVITKIAQVPDVLEVRRLGR